MSDLRELRKAAQSLGRLSEQLRDGTTNSLMAENTINSSIETINEFLTQATVLACRRDLA